ncbi:unnamed protein product [Meganyctiphanes norvegica]|uniref:Uncharacterized protein n=1 Tax=Meganyctiphanes norvegica TaxID=48144 RepID=A0AAV2PSH9_MEGNR
MMSGGGIQRPLSQESHFEIYLQEAAYSCFQRNEPQLTETMINTFREKCKELELDKDLVIDKYLTGNNALQGLEVLIYHASNYVVRVLSLAPPGGKLSKQILDNMKEPRFRAIRNSVIKILATSNPQMLMTYSESFIASAPLVPDKVNDGVLIDNLLQVIESSNRNEHFISLVGKRLSKKKNWRLSNGALLKVLTTILMCEKVCPTRLHLDFQNSCVGPAPSGLLGALDIIVQRNLTLWLDLPWGTQGSQGCAPSAAHDVLIGALRRKGAKATLERLTASIGATAVMFLPSKLTHLSLQLDAIALKHFVGHIPNMPDLRSLSLRIPSCSAVPSNLPRLIFKGDLFVLHLADANDEHLEGLQDLARLCYSTGWYRQVHLEASMLTRSGIDKLSNYLYQNKAFYDQVIVTVIPQVTDL